MAQVRTYKSAVKSHTQTVWRIVVFASILLPLSSQTDDAIAATKRLVEEGRRLRAEGSAVSLKQAIANFQEAAAFWRKSGNIEFEAECLDNIGRAYRRLHDHPQALQYAEQALALYRSTKSRLGEGQAIFSLALVANDKGENQTALRYYEDSLKIFRSVGAAFEERQTLTNLGLVYSELGDQRRAIEFYTEALASARTARDGASEANLLLNLGVEHNRAGQHETALNDYHECLSLYRQRGYGRGEADSLTNIGIIFAEHGEYEKALDYFKQALAVRQRIGDRRGEAITLGDIGEAYRDSGDPRKAQQFLERSLAIQESIEDPRSKAERLNSVGQNYNDLQQFDKALESHRLALEISRSLGDRRLEGLSQHYLGTAYNRSGEKEKALACFREALALLEPAGEKRAQATALYEIAKVLHADGRDAEALSNIDSALQLQEAIRKNSPANELRAAFFGQVREQYELRVELLMQLGRQTEAFEASERARARSLLDMLSGGREPEPLTLAAIQNNVLDKNTVLLEFMLGPQRSFLWVVAADSFDAFVLPNREQIEAAARRAYSAITHAGDSQAALQSLRNMIVPRRAALPVGKRLVIASDGALQYVPFAALPGVIATHEVVSLPSASSVAALRTAAPRTKAERALLVMADPVFDARDPRVNHPQQADAPATRLVSDLTRSAADTGLAGLYRLRYTRREAEQIASLAPASSMRTALDFEASRATATGADIGRYRIVHFATHGLLDSAHPERSGIVLSMVDAKGRRQNGFVRTSDIYGLKLNADLVVLSACQTALGKQIQGEGLIGMTRGFMFAGAPRVVSSLWRVPDLATSELMRRFYQNMFERGFTASAALRRAQLSMRADPRWTEPRNWAGFVMHGEWR